MNNWTISNPEYQSDIENPGLAVSPWCGHRNFIYDYLKYIKPQKVIELGTHYGCSFFAMCQSIKNNNLDIELYAVDTWKGDEQAGFYGSEVWDIVNKTKNMYFNSQKIKLMRMLFNEASRKFDDNTFDLIHIDGLHTYEAVYEDFYTWLPKLKQNGVILFHDVDSKLGYGTNKFWEEIKSKYDYYFEFAHSWGLGILFPKGNEVYEKLIELGFADKLQIYTYKALYEYSCHEVKDLTAMANERFEAINKQGKLIDERDATIVSQTRLIDERDATIASQTRLIDERDATIASQTRLIDERDTTIASQTKLIDERDATIAEQYQMLLEKDALISNQIQNIKEKENNITLLNDIVDEVKKHKIITKIILKGK